jgi:uncharacterized protein YdiU (UPF0061 family)
VPPTLDALNWDNSYARLPEAFYQRVRPTPLPDPHLLAFNPDVAALLDLDPAAADDPGFLAGLNGTRAIAGTDPIAAIYAGHQFGVWVPQLGDGRAILLGEVVNRQHQRWDVQLKGSGLTRFSRMGDGRAVLRSTIREYLAGEAMAGLGVPTTRALAVVGSPAPVYRERTETAAILARVAPTHVRFGTFQLLAARGMQAEIHHLANHVIDHHFPHLLRLPIAARYAAWLREVAERTARLIAQWTAIGFAHGVMNTDNMSIIGLTLDYGPYGWLDRYDRTFICNHTDATGRYAFDQQPMVGLWNCARLGEALQALVPLEDVHAALEAYRAAFEEKVGRLMRAKLGLATVAAEDRDLLGDLLELMQRNATDYHRFFRALSRWQPSDPATTEPLAAELREAGALGAWLERYRTRLAAEGSDDGARRQAMLAVNPRYVLRNWIAQEAIARAEQGDFGPIDTLRQLLARPFDELPEHERFAEPPPDWAREIVVSCSS